MCKHSSQSPTGFCNWNTFSFILIDEARWPRIIVIVPKHLSTFHMHGNVQDERTCKYMRLRLVVCVHPVGVDDPHRMVVTHLVAVAKLVCMEDRQTERRMVSMNKYNTIKNELIYFLKTLWKREIERKKRRAGRGRFVRGKRAVQLISLGSVWTC